MPREKSSANLQDVVNDIISYCEKSKVFNAEKLTVNYKSVRLISDQDVDGHQEDLPPRR